MRIVIAMMKHETNTFSPVPSPLSRFTRDGGGEPPRGQAAYDAFKGTGTSMAAFIDLAEEAGAEIVTPIAASAAPSGKVPTDVFNAMAGPICEAVEAGCDAVLLDLHGAMVVADYDDGEGELLRRLREINADVPIGVALDMHTNMYDHIVNNATALAGFQTYPHLDGYETGIRAGKPIMALMRGEVTPTMAWGNRPMLPHVMRQGTADEPNKGLQERAREMESQGALAVSLFTGFPHADITNAGLSVVVVTDGDMAQAEAWRDELLDRAWAEREAFVYKIEPLEESLARAKAAGDAGEPGDKPVVLLDHYDNAASGGTMDSTTVLAGILASGFDDMVAFAVHDPDSVQIMAAAGVGNEVTLDLGGKTDMPSIGERGQPVQVTGRVKLISDGRFRNRGPASKGVQMDMGPTGVLEIGGVQIIVISRHQEPNDLNAFLSLGIDPREKRYVMLKSRIHYRAAFSDLAREVVECAGTGVCTSDYDQLTFENVRRPIYPLDLANQPD